MLFNSLEFFIFVAIVWTFFVLLGKRSTSSLSLFFLFGTSLFFYAWWEPHFLLILLPSIGFNYLTGKKLSEFGSNEKKDSRKRLLVFGISCNLLLLFYFKYSHFFLTALFALFGKNYLGEPPDLPLGISFFTFTQIAFLVDAFKGKVREYQPLKYGLFVTYFPHLIAGPILHHSEMMSQFEDRKIFRIDRPVIVVGLTAFCIGLFKKMVIADGIAPIANGVFNFSKMNLGGPTFIESWTGALAYTFQLYFDFSGYCDMALGISLLFGIRLPLNFDSPYQANSLIDFWRRWHITLSRFLRDYLYIPMGGNRHGMFRKMTAIFITMLLGGLWHGANWTFIIWGGWHGFMLVLNHLWNEIKTRTSLTKDFFILSILGRLSTFLIVVIGWVFFRADNISSAFSVLKGMFGINNHGWMVRSGDNGGIQALNQNPSWTLIFFILLLLFTFFAPNLAKILPPYFSLNGLHSYSKEGKIKWRPAFSYGLLIGSLLFFIMKAFLRSETGEFLYFNF